MSDDTTLPDTMTIPEFAQRTQISESKAYELAQRGELPVPVLSIGRSVRINRAHFERWIEGTDGNHDRETEK